MWRSEISTVFCHGNEQNYNYVLVYARREQGLLHQLMGSALMTASKWSALTCGVRPLWQFSRALHLRHSMLLQSDGNDDVNLTTQICVQVQQGGAALRTRRPGQWFWRRRAPCLPASPGQGGRGCCRAAGSCHTAIPVKKATASSSATTAASSTWLRL